MSRSTENSGTTKVRNAHRFDSSRLEQWMKHEVAGFEGPLTISQFKGGQSNPTYRLDTPSCSYVLRRKPPGKLLPGAHAVDREYRVISALWAQDFPVAEPVGFCANADVIGTEFYVMAFVEGRIFWEAALPEVPRENRHLYFHAMNRVIAQLHGIDPIDAGLEDYGKPGNYFERQIGRWTRQYIGDIDAGRVASMDRLIEWLPANIPAGEDDVRIVHGDFRCDNMIFHSTEPKVIAVLDWELSTLGHPLADFAYHLMMYRMPAGMTAGLAGLDLAALNIPSEADYVAAYCRRTGRAGIPHLDFYIAFNMFRLAAIIHGIKGRMARGTASSAHAAQTVAGLERLADLAWAQAMRAA